MTSHWIWSAFCLAIVLSTGLGAILILRKESHRPLGWALLIGAVSLAAAGAILARYPNEPLNIWWATHIAATLCLGWMFVCVLVSRHAPKIAGSRHAIEVIEFVSLTSGMVAVAVLVCAAVIEIAFRLVYLSGSDVPVALFPIDPIPFRQSISPGIALLDLVAVAAAAGIGLRLKRQLALATLLFWLATFASLWVALLVAPVRSASRPGDPYSTFIAVEWSLAATVGASLVLLLFVWLQRVADFFTQQRAWPDALDGLLAPPPAWPGFQSSAAVVALAILAIGCLLATHGWTVPSAAIAAVALFLFVHRSWSEILTETAMALMTLAVVSLSMLGVSPPDLSPNSYPVFFHRAIVALAVMAWLWHWLADVWRDQLDHGRPWTTAGRIIPAARRVGFIIAAFGVLIALLLATWPHRPDVTDLDRSLGRWIGGTLSISVLLVALISTTLRTGKPTLGWLSAFTLGALVLFVHFRTGGSATHLWALRLTPLLLAGAAPLLGAVPRVFRMQTTNPYREVFEVSGTALAPLATLIALLLMPESQLAGRWVTTAVLAVLGAWYAVLSISPRLRDLAWVALALANLAAIDLWNQRGASVATVAVATAVEMTISGWILVYIYWSVLQRPAPRIIAALTAPAAGILAAIVVAVARQHL